MSTRREKLSKEKYGIVITLVVMLVSVLLSKSHLNDYFDVTGINEKMLLLLYQHPLNCS